MTENSQVSDMRILGTIINDARYSYEKKIKELEESINSLAYQYAVELNKYNDALIENEKLREKLINGDVDD